MRGATFKYVVTFVLRRDGMAVFAIANRVNADSLEEAGAVAQAHIPAGYELVAVYPAGASDRQPFLV